MTLFSDDDQKQIEAAIAEVEKKSATELVVAILPRSGDYRLPRALAAACWSLAAGLAIATFRPHESALEALLLQIPVAIVAYVLLGIAPLWRLLIHPARAAAEVERRAFSLFAERGLHHTRDRTGMLILVSELEHRVVILGDRAIHERVGDSGWQAHVDRIVRGIRQRQPAAGLLEVIRELEKTHGELLPVTAGDTNELSNEIIRK
jgi:putative membrane protein